MKKVVSLFVAISIIFTLFTVNSFAITKTTKNTLKNVVYDGSSGDDKVTISIDSYKNYTVTRLSNPDRIVVDIPNAEMSDNPKKIDANSSQLKAIRYAAFDKTTVRIVLDVVGQPKYKTEEKVGQLVVYIINPSAYKNVTYTSNTDSSCLTIQGVKLLVGTNNSQKLYEEKLDTTGKKYTITFPVNLVSLESKTIKANDNLLNSVEITTDKKTQRTSITFNAKNKLKYEVVASKEFNNTTINIVNPTSGGKKPPVSGSKDTTPTSAGFNIKCSSKGSQDEVAILLSNYKNYNIMRLTGPERIVIDIPGTNAPINQQKMDVNSKLVKSIRYAQYGKDAARVVLDVQGQPLFKTLEKKDQLILYVTNPTYKNILYHNNGDRTYFSLDGIKLTDGGDDLKKLYTEKYDNNGKKYTITFPSELAELGSGKMQINDEILNFVEIFKDEKKKKTSIVFDAKDSLIYETITRAETDDTAITFFKNTPKTDKLVVIDAGHGGSETGAIYSGVYEKDLNLDIALRLNDLLKSKKLKTYMIREDDSYVGLYERAYIANELKASLFVSVHNNAISDPTVDGTMTLFYPGRTQRGFSGERFAQIVQDSLIKTLRTTNRNTVQRPNLVVLHATTMPSILAEVGFMTNKKELEKLQTQNYRQKVAESLCSAIIKALGELK